MMPYTGPKEYQPLSPWAYWGLGLLYSVPVVGLVFLIIFSFDDGNIHRRNFTRSYWCGLLLAAALIALVLGVCVATGALSQIIPRVHNAFRQLF